MLKSGDLHVVKSGDFVYKSGDSVYKQAEFWPADTPHPLIISKIESTEAIANFDDILVHQTLNAHFDRMCSLPLD